MLEIKRHETWLIPSYNHHEMEERTKEEIEEEITHMAGLSWLKLTILPINIMSKS